jgi:predicted transcriptional regulator
MQNVAFARNIALIVHPDQNCWPIECEWLFMFLYLYRNTPLMKDRQIYRALKLIQKKAMDFKKLNLICERLKELGLIRSVSEKGKVSYELTIDGKVFIWDWENWKLIS